MTLYVDVIGNHDDEVVCNNDILTKTMSGCSVIPTKGVVRDVVMMDDSQDTNVVSSSIVVHDKFTMQASDTLELETERNTSSLLNLILSATSQNSINSNRGILNSTNTSIGNATSSNNTILSMGDHNNIILQQFIQQQLLQQANNNNSSPSKSSSMILNDFSQDRKSVV